MNALIKQEEGYVKPSMEIVEVEIESSILTDSSEVGGEGEWD